MSYLWGFADTLVPSRVSSNKYMPYCHDTPPSGVCWLRYSKTLPDTEETRELRSYQISKYWSRSAPEVLHSLGIRHLVMGIGFGSRVVSYSLVRWRSFQERDDSVYFLRKSDSLALLVTV